MESSRFFGGPARLGLLLASLCVLPSAGGCAWVPEAQLSACQTQCRRLNEQATAQQAEMVSLDRHRREVEDRLISSETQLAALDQQNKANQQRLVNYERQRENLYQGLAGRSGDSTP